MHIDEHGAAWYAIQVTRYDERRVASHLAMRPIPTVPPLIESVRRQSGRAAARLEPLGTPLACLARTPIFAAGPLTAGGRRSGTACTRWDGRDREKGYVIRGLASIRAFEGARKCGVLSLLQTE